MSLIRELTDYIHAAFTGLWIQTHEPDEAERELVEQARTSGWTLAVWDLARGFRLPLAGEATIPEVHDPVGVLRVLPTLALPESIETGMSPATTLLVLPNFHRFLQSYEVVQTLFQTLTAGKQRRIFVVILSPATQVPVELEKQFVII
ncbi:MAG: AAA family ATPase, partial [Planctomycetes bacterium]|nr:AAA family ATPase [Planctomycetota bacterium]